MKEPTLYKAFVCSYSRVHHLGCAIFDVKISENNSSILLKIKKQTKDIAAETNKQTNTFFFVEPSHIRQVKAEFRVFYYEGDCRSLSTQEEIKMNFIKILNESRYNFACQQSWYKDKCRAENVKVKCDIIPLEYRRLKRASGRTLILNGHITKYYEMSWSNDSFFIYSFIHSFTRSLTHSFVHSFIYSFIHFAVIH